MQPQPRSCARKQGRPAEEAAAEEAAADPHTAEVIHEADAPTSAQAAEPAVSQGQQDHPSSSKDAQDAVAEAEGTAAAAGPAPQAADGVAACSQPEHQGKCRQATYDVLPCISYTRTCFVLLSKKSQCWQPLIPWRELGAVQWCPKVFMSVCR